MRKFFFEYGLLVIAFIASIACLYLFDEIRSELLTVIKGVLYIR